MEHGFQLKLSKCSFFQKIIKFLGFIIEDGKISIDKSKLEAIANFAHPTDRQSLHRFLGMLGWYRRFIRGFSSISGQLCKLLKKDSEENATWEVHKPGTEQYKAFEELRGALLKFPIVRFPDFNITFIIIFDASVYGMGAVLAHEHNGFEHPVHYSSNAINSAQRAKHSYYKETLALKRALEYFYHYVYIYVCSFWPPLYASSLVTVLGTRR